MNQSSEGLPPATMVHTTGSAADPSVASVRHLRPRRITRNHLRAISGYTVGIIIGVVAWQIVGDNSPKQIFVPLTTTLHRLGQLVADGTLSQAMSNSFATYGVGLGIGVTAGGVCGIILARSRAIRSAISPYIMAAYSMPLVAWIPFILVILGFGFWPKALVITAFVFFPTVMNTQHGAQSIAPELLDVARLYRTSEQDLWIHVIAPYTLPFFMAGVRQALAFGLVGMITADIFLSSNGLGGMLITASQIFDTAEMFATILVVTICGVALMAIGSFIERYFARWKFSQ